MRKLLTNNIAGGDDDDKDPPSGENCSAWGTTLNVAKNNLKSNCNVTYNASSGHTCEKTPKGKYMCSTNGSGGNNDDDDKDPPTGENCSAWGTTLNVAKNNLKSNCNVTYNASSGHTCEKTPKGKYKCSTN